MPFKIVFLVVMEMNHEDWRHWFCSKLYVNFTLKPVGKCIQEYRRYGLSSILQTRRPSPLVEVVHLTSSRPIQSKADLAAWRQDDKNSSPANYFKRGKLYVFQGRRSHAPVVQAGNPKGLFSWPDPRVVPKIDPRKTLSYDLPIISFRFIPLHERSDWLWLFFPSQIR